VVLQTVAACVRRDGISNLYSVNLEVCESVESRLRRGRGYGPVVRQTTE
jgi:hypothetical protein